jgi:hypothetical protein
MKDEWCNTSSEDSTDTLQYIFNIPHLYKINFTYTGSISYCSLLG